MKIGIHLNHLGISEEILSFSQEGEKMMWVVRAGKNASFHDKYMIQKKIFLPWEGYKTDLSRLQTIAECRSLVQKEKNASNPTSVSNWAGQLYTFAHRIKINDCVLIPSSGSKEYSLATITGDYSYNEYDEDGLYHSRTIKILVRHIPRTIFPMKMVYSLGAYRTVFQVHEEQTVIEAISKLKKQDKVTTEGRSTL